MSPQKRGDNWIDGLRGIAALTVVNYHLCSSFAESFNSPATESGQVFLFQWPFLRLVSAGRFAVALFFIITGYVNSFTSIKQIHNGDHEAVLSKLSRNTISRAGRLVVPTNVAICITWLICQLHGYCISNQVDSLWVRVVSPPPGPTIQGAISGLLRNLIIFWHQGESLYERTYWTIPFFVKGSMMVYLTLLATTFTKPEYTKWVLVFLFCFAWSGGQALMEINIHAGMLLAELNADYGSYATSLMPWPMSTAMILLGLFMASSPEENASRMPWSQALESMARDVVPTGGEINRFLISFGTIVFVFGVFFSRGARRLLSNSLLNFIGRVSFPIYLLHGTLIRTVVCWTVYSKSILQKGLHPVDEAGNAMFYERGGPLTFAVALLIFYSILICVAYLWTVFVDPPCDRIVTWATKKAFGETEELQSARDDAIEGVLKA